MTSEKARRNIHQKYKLDFMQSIFFQDELKVQGDWTLLVYLFLLRSKPCADLRGNVDLIEHTCRLEEVVLTKINRSTIINDRVIF
jgi:hypothetical protein